LTSLRGVGVAQSFDEAVRETGISCSWSFCSASTNPRAKLSWSSAFSLPAVSNPDGPPGVMGVGMNPLLFMIIRSSSGLASFRSFRSGDWRRPAGECREKILRFRPGLVVALFSRSSLRLDLSKFIVPIRSLNTMLDMGGNFFFVTWLQNIFSCFFF